MENKNLDESSYYVSYVVEGERIFEKVGSLLEAISREFYFLDKNVSELAIYKGSVDVEKTVIDATFNLMKKIEKEQSASLKKAYEDEWKKENDASEAK